MPSETIEIGRMEAFSDGVIAIIVTIMVLQLSAPAEPNLQALRKLLPVLLVALSFLVVAMMWVNHHHMVHAVRRVSARLLWSNINLLFWMSLIPFVTDFLGKNPHAPLAVALYGLDLTMCGAEFLLLRTELVRQHGHDPELVEYHSRMQNKNLLSVLLYLSAVGLAYVSIYAAYFIFVAIPAAYFLPERKLGESSE